MREIQNMEDRKSIEIAIIEAIDKMFSVDTAIMVDGKPVSGEEILKEQVEQILREADINLRVVVLRERDNYGVYLLAPDVDLSPLYLEGSYFFPQREARQNEDNH